MIEPWLRLPRFRPRPSVQKALVFTLGRPGFIVCPLQLVLVSVCYLPFGAPEDTRLQFIWVRVSNSPFGALDDPRLQFRVVSLVPLTCIISTVYYLPCKLLHWSKSRCGEGQTRSLGRIVCSFVSGCRVNGNASSVGGVVQGEVQEVVLLHHDPQSHSTPPLKKLVPLELDGDEVEEEGGEGQRRVRSVLTHPPVSGFHVPWTMPFTMFQFGSKNVNTQPRQRSQRSHGHPRLFSVRDCSLRKPRVRWWEHWREQASLQGTIPPTQIRVHLISMHVQWWRSNHPPPWMLKPVAWLFWRPLLQSQNVGTVVTVRNGGYESVMFFGSIHVEVCLSVMSIVMYVGTSMFVNFPLASAGIGSFWHVSSFTWVLVWSQWTVSSSFSLSGSSSVIICTTVQL
jgi:hypothetical protein